MAGTKRAADDSGPTTRASKTQKKSTTSPASKAKKGGKTAKPAIPFTQFKAKALPLHVNLTHTPPALPEADVPDTPADPGSLGTLTLVTAKFNTGSYGWKGNKRVKVELQNESGEKETVDVQFTINATVLNSKGADDDGEDQDEKEEKDEAEAADGDKE